jgi:hypothetical protein
VSERMQRTCRGVRVGAARPPLVGCSGVEPPTWGFGGSAPGNFCLEKRVMYLGGFFGTWFLLMVFYFW